MLKGVEVKLNYDYFENKEVDSLAERVIYTGLLTIILNIAMGLEYRSLRFENEILENQENYQCSSC
jgi:UDP-galactopyranose mutase